MIDDFDDESLVQAKLRALYEAAKYSTKFDDAKCFLKKIGLEKKWTDEQIKEEKN